MNSSLKAAVESFIAREKLPAEYMETVEEWFIPLTEKILQKLSVSSETLVVGISGCQGSGKSTLADLLVILLRELMGISSINLSIDDFYLTQAERQVLADTVHPLLATRGVPGTHDVTLALETIKALKVDGEVAIPRFNKAIDDRLPQAEWPKILSPVDVIIIEGWCLNIVAEAESALDNPVNDLERNEDKEGRWRSYVNEQLLDSYPALYNLVDYLIMLKAPDFEKVFEWRQTQEDKLALLHASQDGGASSHKIMSQSELKRFIQHYERLTRHGLQSLPEQADRVFLLSNEQTILGLAS